MTKKDILIIADYTQETPITFDELCQICRTSPDFIQELIELEVIHPAGKKGEWVFDLVHLNRIQTAMRLHHDLEVNMAGIAVILDLLDEMEELRQHAALWRKHLLR